MESVYRLERLVAEWYKKAPRLPDNGRKWLAANAWWIALIGAIVSAFSIMFIIFAVFIASAMVVGFGVVGAALAGFGLVTVMISLVFSVTSMVLTFMAVAPLKGMQKRGWTLIFITVLIEVASQVLGLLLNYNLLGFLWSLFLTAVGAYFLFEIRSYFVIARSSHKPVEVKKHA